jgi:hypothetical protein
MTTKFINNGLAYPVTLDFSGPRIYIQMPYNKKLLEEIKAMDGAKWHGYDEPKPRKVWSVKNSGRNRFQIAYLEGKDPYANYDKELIQFESNRPLYDHQREMASHCLTYHYVILAAEMGTGKTLAAIEAMEHSGIKDWWYIAPASVLRAIDLELFKWESKIRPKLYTYEALVKLVGQWRDGDKAPQGVIFDESSRVKTPTAKRTQAALHLAESIREDWGDAGYVILMSGSPAPKSPVDWWSQCEITCPGFIKEGNVFKFKQRLGLIVNKQNMITGGMYPHLITWKDDENKCDICGKYKDDHDPMIIMDHTFKPSKNEVSYLYERMKGLVNVKFKKDCLDLPDKIYKKITLTPSKDTLQLANLIKTKSTRAIEALTMLRELSDGFQYIDTPDGETECQKCEGKGKCTEYSTDEENPNSLPTPFETICDNCGGSGKVTRYKREARQIETPKEQALIDLLEDHEDARRIVIYAGFTGSIDRCYNICSSQGWKIIRVDGRGWYHPEITGNPLIEFQAACSEKYDGDKIAFVGHPESGGMGLTLTASPSIVYYSNDFKAENRIQSEDRIHRLGTKGATIIDLIHLPTDELVLENLRKKRELQALSMGQLREVFQ